MRAAWAETVPSHPDAGLRPRVYEANPDEVAAATGEAAGELRFLQLAEVDARRRATACWVRLVPLPRPRGRGQGWSRRFDPRLAMGWLQVRWDSVDEGKTRVDAYLRLENPLVPLPLPRPLAARLLKAYLRRLDEVLSGPVAGLVARTTGPRAKLLALEASRPEAPNV